MAMASLHFILISTVILTFGIQMAKAKLLKWRVHETGGGPAPAQFNRIEEAVIRILGKTPEFAGVVSAYFGDSRIEMRQGPNNNDLMAKVCKAKKIGRTSNLVRAMNTNTTLDVGNMTKNLKKAEKSKQTVTAGSAIKCVECNSHYEKWCEDIPADFNYTKHASNKYNEYLTDCDTKDGGSVDGLSYTMCRTMSQKVGSDASRTIRMCAAHGKADKCYERTGTKNIKLSYCTCEGDWCNSASTLLGPRLIILSTISVILALISIL